MASTLLLSVGAAFSQGLADAYKYVPNGGLNGTARSMGMGGAFGALGGDISVLNSNPAGLAVYHSSEVATTGEVSVISTKTDWRGNGMKADKTKFDFDNIAYVGYFPTGNDVGLLSWNVGFSYNRLKNYSRKYSLRGSGDMGASLADYVAARANKGNLTPGDIDFRQDENGNITYDPYESVGDWLSVLSNDAGFLNYNNEQYESSLRSEEGIPYSRSNTELNVYESGAIDQYSLAFGANISDFLLLGATISINDLRYDLYSYYAEDYASNKNSYIELENGLTTKGTGYGINIGAIYRPVDFLRIGVAYNSPTWYKMTDYYDAKGASDIESLPDAYEAYSPIGASTKYKFHTPDKWIFSAAAIVGQTALLSVDYEVMNYRRMHLSDAYGNANVETNDEIDQRLGVSNTVRVGAEAKVTPQFAVRAGFSWSDSGMSSALREGNTEVITVGTLPHYTLANTTTNYTVGLGYRFTPQFYVDLACIFKTVKEDAYAFSTLYSGDAMVQSVPSSLKTTTTRVALTLGYKF